MPWKKNSSFFLLPTMVLGFALATLTVSSCIPVDPERTRIVDAQGKTIYEPSGEPSGQVQIPTTGHNEIDALIALVSAAVFGSYGYWIRRSNKANQASTISLFQDQQRLRADIVHLSNLIMKGADVEELHKIRQLISGVPDSKNGSSGDPRDPGK